MNFPAVPVDEPLRDGVHGGDPDQVVKDEDDHGHVLDPAQQGEGLWYQVGIDTSVQSVSLQALGSVGHGRGSTLV